MSDPKTPTENEKVASYLAHPWQEDAAFMRFIDNPKACPPGTTLREDMIAWREKCMRLYAENCVLAETHRARFFG